MYRRIGPSTSPVSFTFEDRILTAEAGDTVAAALLLANVHAVRQTPVSGAHRAPFCMMGICFDCLVEIDGLPNRQGCMVQVTEGMKVRRQRGMPEVAG